MGAKSPGHDPATLVPHRDSKAIRTGQSTVGRSKLYRRLDLRSTCKLASSPDRKQPGRLAYRVIMWVDLDSVAVSACRIVCKTSFPGDGCLSSN